MMRGLLIVATLAVASAASAQDLPVLRLSLEDAQRRALATSHRLAEGRARVVAADSEVAIREAASRPLLSVTGGYMRTNHVTPFFVTSPLGIPQVIYPDVPNNYRSRMEMAWPIYTGGQLEALERAARAEASAVAADVDAARADLRLEVARAFWALVTARAAVTVIEQGVTRAQAHLGDVRQSYAAGLLPPNDVASAEARESRERMLLIEARNQRDQSSADLARLIDNDLLQPIEPDAPLDLAAAVSESMDVLVARARATRDERRGLELRIEANEEMEDAALRRQRPRLDVLGGVDTAKPNPKIFPRADRWAESWDASINLTWVFWDGGRSRAEAAQAAAFTVAARERLAEFDSGLSLELRQRLLDLDSGRAAVSAADDAARAAAEARRVVAERFRVGVATPTEVLDADGVLLQANLDRTRALATVRLAEARLTRALGQ